MKDSVCGLESRDVHEDVNEAGEELTEYGPLRKRPREHNAHASGSASALPWLNTTRIGTDSLLRSANAQSGLGVP